LSPEFSYEVDAETVSDSPRRFEIGADEAERRRLAGRFRLLGIDRLSADVTLQRRAGIIHADGEVDAEITQACVVTDEPLEARVRAPFHVRYVPDALGGPGEEEVELSAEDCDTLPLDGGRIDLGELAAETLALALDPYPRSPDADAVTRAREAEQSEDAGPFAALKALKDKL
jgi:uncharacterized metal-binding protein YceD (DUF177 family)